MEVDVIPTDQTETSINFYLLHFYLHYITLHWTVFRSLWVTYR